MKLSMKEPINCSTYRVIYADTDAGGVVYYGSYLQIFERARTEYMRDLVCTYRTIADRGLVLPVVECYVRYKAPAVYDDLLFVETSLVEVRTVSCRFHYRIYRNPADESAKPVLLTKGSTMHAVVDVNGRLTKLPEEILKKLQKICPPKD
jgi:acyl-CoA thioester hydrolase